VRACPPGAPPDEITRGLFGLGRRLTRTHPLAGDALLAAVLLGLCSAWLSWSSWAGYRAAIVQTALIAALIFRRRHPSAVFVATSAIAFVQWLLGFPLLGDVALVCPVHGRGPRVTDSCPARHRTARSGLGHGGGQVAAL
jgi:hypothetical protein